jgi:hypothetical protein
MTSLVTGAKCLFSRDDEKTIDSGPPSRLLFFHHDCNGPIRRQAYLLSFDIRDEHHIDKVMMAFVSSFAAVGLGEPDPAVLNAIDSSDMNPIRSDHFHIALYFVTFAHSISPPL